MENSDGIGPEKCMLEQLKVYSDLIQKLDDIEICSEKGFYILNIE